MMKVVIINSKLYILHGKLAWSFLVDKEFNHAEKPLVLNEWLKFLPKSMKKLTSVYQRPNINIVMLIDGLLYMFNSHNLQLRCGYPTNTTLKFGLSETSVIQYFINTYTSKTCFV